MEPQTISLVVAYTQNRVIGLNGGMPWSLPKDLAHFKKATLGHPIIMGRNTWLSLGRPLPGRRNIVLSRKAGFQADGAEVFSDINTALKTCRHDSKICIIGGEQIFRLALPLANEIIATEIKSNLKGDTWFPEIASDQWLEIGRDAQAAENGFEYDFVTYKRK